MILRCETECFRHAERRWRRRSKAQGWTASRYRVVEGVAFVGFPLGHHLVDKLVKLFGAVDDAVAAVEQDAVAHAAESTASACGRFHAFQPARAAEADLYGSLGDIDKAGLGEESREVLPAVEEKLTLLTNAARGRVSMRVSPNQELGHPWPAGIKNLRGEQNLKLLLRGTRVVCRCEDLGKLDDALAGDESVFDGGNSTAPFMSAKCVNQEALVRKGDSRVEVCWQLEHIANVVLHAGRVLREQAVADIEALDADAGGQDTRQIRRPSTGPGTEIEDERTVLEPERLVQDQSAVTDVVADEVVLLVEPDPLLVVGGEAIGAVGIAMGLSLQEQDRVAGWFSRGADGRQFPRAIAALVGDVL